MQDLSLAIPIGFGKRKTKSLNSTIRLNLFLLILILGVIGAYLFTITSLGTKGYEIRKLEQQVKLLQAEQKKLQVEASDLQSITNIQSTAEKLNFVPASNVTYLKDSDFALK